MSFGDAVRVTVADALASERAAGLRLVQDLQAELAGIIADQQANPPDDEHDVDGSSVGYERARVAAMLAHAEARLVEVEAAVQAAGAPSHASCDVCGGAIGDDRLSALPSTRCCVACASGGGRMRPGPGLDGRRLQRG